MNSPTDHFTTKVLTQLLTTALLRAAPRRAWLALLIIAAISLALAAAGLFARYVRERMATAAPIYIIVATPAPALAAGAPTAQSPVPLPALYDYRRPDTATTIDSRRIACVVGTAESGAWQLVALDRCDVAAPRVWLAAGLLPDSVPVASQADLTPRTAVPAPVADPGYRVSSAQQQAPDASAAPPVEIAAPPAATPEPPIFVLPEARDFGPGSRSGGSWECVNPAGC